MCYVVLHVYITMAYYFWQCPYGLIGAYIIARINAEFLSIGPLGTTLGDNQINIQTNLLKIATGKNGWWIKFNSSNGQSVWSRHEHWNLSNPGNLILYRNTCSSWQWIPVNSQMFPLQVLCERNPPVTGGFLTQIARMRKTFPRHDVFMVAIGFAPYDKHSTCITRNILWSVTMMSITIIKI